MKTTTEPKRWAIIGTVATVLLIIWTTALGGSPSLPANSQQSESTRVQVTDPISVNEELVRLEDSLQWNGRDPIELPVSFSVTDLLPARC